jgi:hypothetical protein
MIKNLKILRGGFLRLKHPFVFYQNEPERFKPEHLIFAKFYPPQYSG